MQAANRTIGRRLSTLRELGLFAGSVYLLKRLLETGSGSRVRVHAYHLVAQPVKREPVLGPRRGRSIEVREIGLEEAAALPVPRPRLVVAERFRQGARCLCAYSGGRFLGFLWYLTGPYEEDEVRCRFVPLPQAKAAWDFDVYVEPSMRIGLTFARLWDEANARLSSAGMRWSLSRISALNAGSLAAHGKLGVRRLASAVFVGVGPVQLTMATTWPYVHLALGRGSRPVMRLRAD